jgi:hypothetical protein
VARIREELPPIFDLVTPMPYVQLQQLFDEANAFGFRAYDKAAYLNANIPPAALPRQRTSES